MPNQMGFYGCVLLALAGLFSSASTKAEAAVRSRETFNERWRFDRFGPMPDGSLRMEPRGLEVIDVDDSVWRPLNLPHDWGVEGPFRQDLPGKTGKLPWAGIGWYRKHFRIPQQDREKRIFVDFDGAMSNSTVYLNGKRIGSWPYGYSSFRVELTDELDFDGENVLAVRLDNKAGSSRWYPGGGIYRNVWLIKTNALHLAHWGTFISTPAVTDKKAIVDLAITVENQSDERRSFVLEAELRSSEDASKVVARAQSRPVKIEAGSTLTEHLSTTIRRPQLWSLEDPSRYVAITRLICKDQVTDEQKTSFGVRTIEYDASRGFLLNGNQTKIQGVCLHHDLGPLGAAISTRAIQRQIELLQEMGCNAIRTSHNPPAPELLDLCDRMGLLVQVEAFDCWAKGKTNNDYSQHFEEWHERDLVSMVRRDRNHPSVVMWSTGNEIREQGGRQGHALSRKLTNIVHREDPTRPVSAGCNNVNAGKNGFQHTVDVFGYNYKPHAYERFLKNNPTVPLYGSETASCISSRGEYFFPVVKDKSKGRGGPFQMSSYDLSAPSWAMRPDIEFAAQDRHPNVFGEFVWTGFDYLGEPTPYNNDSTNLLNTEDPKRRAAMQKELDELGKIQVPSRSSYFGILDLCGFKKDRFYLYQAKWRPDLPMAHILPHWNWPERIGKVTPVHVYTSGDEAELFLNDRSLGRKRKERFQYRLEWENVVYEPGELRAIAYKNGKRWADARQSTTGAARKLLLLADRARISADGHDLSYITVRVEDEQSRLVPRSNPLVRFTLDGPGEIVAVGNGDATSHQPFQAQQIAAYNGLCLAIVRSTKGQPGTLSVRAKSEGLTGSNIGIVTE